MKVTCIGFSRIDGEKNSRQYDMGRLIILVPAESREGTSKLGDKYRVRAGGFDTAELDLSVDAIPSFQKLTFPIDLELDTDSELRFGRMQSVVTGFIPEAKQ
jgi:hypothetical protein